MPRVTLKMWQRHMLWKSLQSMDPRLVWGLTPDELADRLSLQLAIFITPSIAERARRIVVPKPPLERQPWWRKMIDRLTEERS